MSRQARQRRRRHNRSGPTRILLVGGAVIAAVLIAGAIAATGYVLNVARSAPALESLHPILGNGSSEVYAADGTRLGFHVIATCDTYNNVNRFLSRKAFSEFEMRVLFQMSANDSASLIDNPKASLLGLHRALFYNAQEGYLETFRPYALPGSEWIEAAARHLAR